MQWSLDLGLCYSYRSNERHLLVSFFNETNLTNRALPFPRNHPPMGEPGFMNSRGLSSYWLAQIVRTNRALSLEFINQEQRETFTKASPCSTMHDLSLVIHSEVSLDAWES